MSSLNNELSQDRRAPYSFDNEEDFRSWLDRSNMSLRPTLRLRLRPPRPPNPEMMNFGGMNFPVSVPEANPNYAWVTNRDTLEGAWHPLNTPITQDAVGPTTFRQIGDDQTFQPQHHGINVAAESRMSDDQLRQNLQNWNLPTEGDRSQLFQRNMRVKHHPTFMRNFAEGRQPNEAEVSDVLGNNQPMSLREAARMRGLRSQAGYYQNVQPPPVSRPRPGGNMGSIAGLGRQAPMAGAGQGGGLAGRIAPQANAAAGEAAAAEGGALAGGAAAGEAGLMGGAGMMAARAVPILNMVLLGKMLMDGVTSSSKEAKAKQQQLMYRT